MIPVGDGFVFLRPAWLLLLPLVVLLAWWLGRRHWQASPWTTVVDAALQAHVLAGGAATTARWLAPLGLFIGGVLAVLALAGPARPGPQLQAAPAAARVLLLDLSPAMALPDATGEAPAARARRLLADLIAAMPDGDTGLAIYGEDAYRVSPLTGDRDLLRAVLPELDPAVIPAPGARPERGLRLAADMLPAGAVSGGGEIVWLTGQASPPVPVALPAGVSVSVVHLAPSVDQSIWAAWAAAHGGRSLAAAEWAALLPLLRGGQWPAGTHDGWQDIGGWLLLPLLPLVAWGFRRGALFAWVLTPMLAMMFAPAAFAPSDAFAGAAEPDDRIAWTLASRQEWAAAAERFADPRWRAVAHYRAGQFAEAADGLRGLDDPESLHNRGNALARAGRYAEAVAAYEAALGRREMADTRFNLELVRRLLREPPAERPRQAPPERPRQSPPNGPKAPPAGGPTSPQAGEAARIAEQWLGSVSASPPGLLARRLQQEHARRRANAGAAAW